ncbi:MAG: carbohydrate porin [Planctomycetia bacterium]|nr:carbohydrate porin [Planctomycetia bacterium]
MRPTFFRLRCAARSVAALLIVAALDSLVQAQLPADRFTGSDSTAEAAPGAPSPPEFGGPLRERPKLTGDWLGGRSRLRDRGITLDVSSTQYYQGVAAGGREQAFQFGGRNDYFLNLDGEKLGLWTGLSVDLHGEARYGESVNALAGTLLAPNFMLSVPLADGSITALTGVTFTQYLTDDFLVYGGKVNTQDDTEQPLTGAGNLSGFQNTAMLYNPVYARTIPYSTYGAGFTCFRNEEALFSACVYDTNDTPTTSGFDTFFNNGATVYAELNFPTTFFDRPGNHGLSGTYSSGRYSNLTPSAYLDPIEGFVVVSPTKTGSWCVAYNFDQALYVSPDDPERMWGVFGNFGIADKNPSPVRWFASVGISGASRITGRIGDTFGAAYYYLGVSEPLKDLFPVLLPLRDERGVEFYYNMALTPSCHITPDLQVITPFRERAETSLIVGLRAHLDF